MGNMTSGLRDVLREKLTAKPFQPFTIVTADGTRYPVVRQFQAAVGERYILVVPSDDLASKMVAVDQVKTLEPA